MRIETLTPDKLARLMEADQEDRYQHELSPDNIETLRRYIDNRIEPGSFVRAVLENDLKTACSCADMVNRRKIFEYVEYLYQNAPSPCWGSPEKVDAWLHPWKPF